MSKHTRIGLKLLHSLSKQGKRIFPLEKARHLAQEHNINPAYLNVLLVHLRKNLWIYPLKRGMYALDVSLLETPIHEWEIGSCLVNPSMLSHFTAFHYHELTDQIPLATYLSTPKILSNFVTFREVKGMSYHFIQTKPEYYFGGLKIGAGESEVFISDLEKTLLDGLRHPGFCGGFSKVLQAYEEAKTRLDLEKMLHYAFLLEGSIIKRLGWVLEHVGIEEKWLRRLEEAPFKGFRKLNPSGGNFGLYNEKWNIRENNLWGRKRITKSLK